MKRARIAIIVLVVLALAGVGIWWGVTHTAAKNTSLLTTSGFLESNDTSVSFEVGGRLVALNAKEGDTVKAGDVLAKVDDTLIQAQKTQAQATAQSAAAALAQAQVSADAAKAVYQRALDVKNSPSMLDPQVIAAQSSVTAADLNLSKAKADTALAIATLQEKIITDQNILTNLENNLPATKVGDFVMNGSIYPAELALNTDQLSLKYQQDLLASYTTPTIANAKDTATQTIQALIAADNYAATQANNSYLVAGAALKSAQNGVDQANAALQTISVTLAKYSVTAPISGVIVTKNNNIGEIAQPGAAIYTIADVSQATLDVYVPESKIGLVKIGQKASITVDSYPGQIFPGTISYISPRAEYTPQNLQTQGQHLDTMAVTVKISIPNADYKLKEGVAATANISVAP